MGETAIFNLFAILGLVIVSGMAVFLVSRLGTVHRSFKMLNRSTRQKAEEWEAQFVAEDCRTDSSLENAETSKKEDFRRAVKQDIGDSIRQMISSGSGGSVTLHRGPEVNTEYFEDLIFEAARLAAQDLGDDSHLPALIESGKTALRAAIRDHDDHRYGDANTYYYYRVFEGIIKHRNSLKSMAEIIGKESSRRKLSRKADIEETTVRNYSPV